VIQIETTGQLNLTPAVLSIYLGKPDGTFGTPTTFMPYPTTFNSSTGNNVTAFGLGSYFGDFNGDGNTDIALFQFAQSGGPSFVQFLAGNGDGTFTKTFDSFPTYIEFAPDTIIPNAFGDGRTAFLQTPNYAASFQIIPAIVAPSLQTRFVETPVVSTMDALEIDLNVASNSDTTVNLAASDPGVQIPASATIPAGSLSVQIPFSLSASFAKNQWFSVTAQAGGTTSVAYDYALPVNFTSPFAMFVSSGGNLVPPGPVPALTPGQTSTWGVAFETFSNASSTFQVSCSNLPANLSCTNFSPPSITVAPGIPVGLTFDIPIGTNITPGLYPFTITATDGFTSLVANPTLPVSDFTISVSPPTQTVLPTSFDTLTVTIGPLFGFVESLSLSCSGLPAGATCQSTGVPSTQSQSGSGIGLVLTNVAPGTYAITVTATNGAISHSATAQVTVSAEPAITVNSTLITVPPALVGSPGTQSFQITNSGTAPLVIQSLTLNGEEGAAGVFGESDTCKTAVPAGASCTATITFTPSAVGRASAGILFASNVPGPALNIPILASGVDFSVGAPTIAPISPGQTATFQTSITANQFTGTVTVTCVGAIPEGQCTTPGSLTIASNTTLSVLIAVTTTAASDVGPHRRIPESWPPPEIFFILTALFLGAAGFGFLANKSNGRRARRLRGAFALVVLTFTLATLASCGGGGSSFTVPVQHDPGTPAGTYNFTVTFSGAGGSRSLQLSVIVN
jgi:hypothetical protein